MQVKLFAEQKPAEPPPVAPPPRAQQPKPKFNPAKMLRANLERELKNTNTELRLPIRDYHRDDLLYNKNIIEYLLEKNQ